jgi:hypothetical protein
MSSEFNDLGPKLMTKLMKDVERGHIDPVYDDINDWLCDFWPDLPWNPEGQEREVRKMLKHERLEDIHNFFFTKYGLDFKKMLNDSI